MNRNTIEASQAKIHFLALLENAETGKEYLITKNGKPVAKLVPITHIDKIYIKNTIRKLKAFNKTNKLGLNWKTLHDNGRR